MDNSVLTKGHKIHFIGIGGISMSALARILMDDGCIVTGSDMKESHITKQLEEYGAQITIGQSDANITDQDLVVYTAAVKEDNPEFMAAVEKGIEIIDRAELLGAIMKRYDNPIAVSGTHGKTSTTGMISQIFLEADMDPTVTIGGELDVIGGNLRVGKKEIFIAEACEYHRSFLKFSPKTTVILNIEEDHLDFFTGLDDIIDTFNRFAHITPDDGVIVANADDKNVLKALEGVNKRIVTVGIENSCNYKACDIKHDALEKYTFKVFKNGSFYTDVALAVPGTHNVYNALCAFAVADLAGIDKSVICSALGKFIGAHRRFERKGYFNNALIVDDYAHHPSEINATLTAAKNMGFKNVYCVFQPHTYTRTKMLFDDFVKVFKESDVNVIITDIFAAREKDTGLVSSQDLAQAIESASYIKSFDEVEEYLRDNLSENDLVITMGAGDVYKIGENILKLT
ncbi:MAG: UDP-N-acetylmuramate--L-alanine ligase [Clostridia bacterium]|nr:UDP-N-acetylmuramate--L-alanine ligase [Clostridia bacterium]